MDDVDAQSPTAAPGRQSSEAYVDLGEEQVLRQEVNGTPTLGRRLLNVSFPVRQLSPIPSRHDSEGADSTDAVVNAGREAEEQRRPFDPPRNDSSSVMLISSRPGQAFNSLVSPITAEADALVRFHMSTTQAPA